MPASAPRGPLAHGAVRSERLGHDGHDCELSKGPVALTFGGDMFGGRDVRAKFQALRASFVPLLAPSTPQSAGFFLPPGLMGRRLGL